MVTVELLFLSGLTRFEGIFLCKYCYTVNRQIFVVKIFSDRLTSTKIKHTKIVCIINANAVRGRLSENYLTRKFIARNIFDTKYSRFTVSYSLPNSVMTYLITVLGEMTSLFTGCTVKNRISVL